MTDASAPSLERTVQFVQYSNPDWTPPVINQTRLLARAGWRIDVICRDYVEPPSVSYPREARITRLTGDGRSSGREYLNFIRAVLRSADPNARVVVGHDMHGFVAARLLAWQRRIPVVYHCHDFSGGWRTATGGGRIVAVLERLLARTAALVVVPDAERAEVIANALRLPTAPLVVANSAPCDSPAPHDALRPALLERGLDLNRIVYRQGRVGPHQTIETTIRSMPSWEVTNSGFVVLGHATPEYKQHLKDLARSLRVSDRFVVLPGVSYDEFRNFAVGADVGHGLYDPVNVNTRYVTTASNKLMDYLSAGIPLLVSDRPSMRALVERYRCGLVADESDPSSIARAVNTLLADPAAASAMGAAGRQAFEQFFCYEHQYGPALSRLESLASRQLLSPDVAA